MERTAQNRVIFGAGTKKKKSRNPHGYWIFRWRSGWDSNPRAREDYLISSQARYDHFDTAPYMFSRRFSLPFSGRKRLWKELTERTANYSVFRTGQNPHGYTVSAGRNGQLPTAFRVSPVMTTSIRLHISCNIFRHHNDNIIHQKKSFVNHFLSFPVPKALLNMLRSKNIIIISSAPSSMLTTGISCTHFTATIAIIAIITVKASNAGTQQIILNGFVSL